MTLRMTDRTKLILHRRIAGEEYKAIAASLGMRLQAVRMACYRAMWTGKVTAEQIRYAPTVPVIASDEEYDRQWLERLATKCRPGKNGCIEVPGVFHNEDGYAVVHHRRLGQFCHRTVVILNGRPIPPGFMACHRCGNHGCVNDAHIYVGTMKENARDTVMMGRHRESQKTHCIHGHEFTPENTYYYKTKRRCRICQKRVHSTPSHAAWRREYQRKRRALKRAKRQTEALA